MAITISFPAANIVTDLTAATITATDGSTYGSPARNTLAVFVKICKMDYTGNRTALTTTPNNTDPTNVLTVSWSATYSADGWHQILYAGVPAYSGGTTYALYDAVYDGGNVYRSKSAGNVGNATSDTSFWELITDPTSLALTAGTSLASPNLATITSTAILSFGVKAAIAVAFGTQTGNAFLEMTSDYLRSQDVRVYELLALGLEAIKIADSRQNYSALEIYARRAESIISSL